MALLARISARDPTVFSALEVLRIATTEGARAVGLGAEVGSLEPGKQADLVLVDLTTPNLTPVRNIVPNLVDAASGHEVKAVMVAGKMLVQDGRVLTLDEAVIRAEAQAEAAQIARNVAVDPTHRNMALPKAMAEGRL